MSTAGASEVDAMLAAAKARKKKKEAEEAEKKKKEDEANKEKKAAADAKAALDAAASAKAAEAAAAAKKAADDALAAKAAAAAEADAAKAAAELKAKKEADNKASKALVDNIVSGEYYWLPHAEHAWVAGKRSKDTGSALQFVTDAGVTVERSYSELKGLEKVAPGTLTADMPNLVALEDLSEASVLHQLRTRYQNDTIYTNIGTILVSVNPYKVLPIYISSVVDDYKHAVPGSSTPLPPHVFQIAADAYRGLQEEGRPQAVIISGESGAGKTEATKMILQYLSEVAQSESGVEQEILMSNPVLESFGNAKTVRNNNSSRFGKWQEVKFLNNGRVYAARIVNYLLEKSRVTQQAKNERNYHVFYQLCAGASAELKKQLSLDAPQSYEYLKQSGCLTIDGVNDSDDFSNTSGALSRLGFTADDVQSIWTLLAGILHLGNVKLESDGKEGSRVAAASAGVMGVASSVLKVDGKALESALTARSISVSGSMTHIPLKPDEANEARHALARAIYGRLFDWLIVRVNASLNKNQGPDRTIGILDIFGFECFENNSFEQFCINYANEKLQQHFQLHLFKYEQEEYKAEGIPNAWVDFVDNSECLALIERKPVGLISMLDEEVVLPKGSDSGLVAKYHQTFAGDKADSKHKCYAQIKQNPAVFVIKHYAGDVTYHVTGFLAKNKDRVHDTLAAVADKSELKLLADLWKDAAAPADGKTGSKTESPKTSPRNSPRGRPGSAGKRAGQTLAGQFQGQLTELMSILHAADPHYIRCIKPNASKVPNVFSSALVLQQMRYAGLFEAIRIRKTGYPCRRSHESFAKRFRVVLGAKVKDIKEFTVAKPNYLHQCLALLKALSDRKDDGLDAKQLVMGKTKVFYRTSARAVLNALRDKALESVARCVQRRYTLYRLRKRYRVLLACYRECQAALKLRTAAALESAMASLDKHNASGELFVEKELKKLAKYLKEEERVCRLLEAAVKTNQVLQLSSAIEEAQRLAKANPKETVAARLQTFVKEATKAKDKLTAAQDARVKIKNAVVEEELKALQDAIKAAKAAGLPAAELKDAEELCARLQKEENLVVTLKKFVADDDAPLSGVEKALSEVEALSSHSGDAARGAVVESAHACLVRRYMALLDEEAARGGADAEAKLKDVLLPKFEHFGEWADPLIRKAQDWLFEEEKRKAAEAERVEREKAEAERKKAQDEKRKKDEADKKKREDELKRKRDEEEAKRKKQLEDDKTKRQAEAAAEREKREAAEAAAEAARKKREDDEEAARLAKEAEDEKAHAKAEAAADAQRKKDADAKRAADDAKRAADKEAAEKKRKEATEKKKAEEEAKRWQDELDRAALKTRAMSILPGSKVDDDDAPPPPPSSAATTKPAHNRMVSSVPPPPAPAGDDDTPPPPAPEPAAAPAAAAGVKKLQPSAAQDKKTAAPAAAAAATAPAAGAGAGAGAATAAARNDLMRKSIFQSGNAARMQQAIALVKDADTAGLSGDDAKRMEACTAAIKARDLAKLTLAIADLSHFDADNKILRVAQTLEKQLIAEKKVLDRVKLALEEMDEGELQRVLQMAQDAGLSADIPELAKARQFAYGMSRNDFLLARIAQAISKQQVDKVKALSEQASKLGLPLMEAKQYLLAEANKAMSGANQKYTPFLSLKGQFQLEHFNMLRREGNYAKGEYLKKTYYKKMRLLFQKDDIPRSLFKLSIAYCGSVDKSKAIKKQAQGLFKSVRGYMGDVFHAYPTTLGQEIVDFGRREPLIRDEIYCQLIKQTTQNPNADSLLKGWRLMFLCLSNFPCSKELSSFLLSHIAASAHAELPQELGVNSVKDLASNCFFAYEQTNMLNGKKLPPGLGADGISDVTKGNFKPLKVAELSIKISGGAAAGAGADAKTKK